MFTDIFHHIASIAKKEGRLPKASPALLRQIWPQLVGPQIAHLTHPLELQGSTLSIAVGHQELLTEWRRNCHPLLQRITALSPWPIDHLEFAFNPDAGLKISIPDPPPKKTTMPPPEVNELKGQLQDAGLDKELVDILASIAQKRSRQ